jgi:sortase A
MSYKKRLLIFFVLLAGAYVFLNAGYFYMNGKFLYSGRKETYVQTQQEQVKEEIKEPVKVEPNVLFISSLDITAPIVYTNGTTEDEFQKALAEGVVHYPGTAEPGQRGNAYIFGHSSDFVWSKGKYKTVFALLPKIKEGDIINISDKEGNPYTYKVTGTKVVAPNALEYLKQDLNKKTLTLQTSYPLGTALKRFLVFAELQ